MYLSKRDIKMFLDKSFHYFIYFYLSKILLAIFLIFSRHPIKGPLHELQLILTFTNNFISTHIITRFPFTWSTSFFHMHLLQSMLFPLGKDTEKMSLHCGQLCPNSPSLGVLYSLSNAKTGYLDCTATTSSTKGLPYIHKHTSGT